MKIPPARLIQRISLLALPALVAAAALLLWNPSSIEVVKASSTLGQPIPDLSPLETTLFNIGYTIFAKPWLPPALGPVYTQSDCATCHASPVVGGGSPGNSETDVLFGTVNSDGSFNNLASEGGPYLQPKSIMQSYPKCPVLGEILPHSPPPTLLESRVTSQLFGAGLIDSVPDSAILAEAQSQQMNMPFGIAGQANLEPDENGVIRPGRFGYKAESADLIQAVSSGMLDEVGITNPVLPIEMPPQGRKIPKGCLTGEPNDLGQALIAIYHFLIYLAPNPFPQNPNQQGENLFNSIGCSTCHLPSYTTAPKVKVWETWPEGSEVIISKALSNQTLMLYSDLLLHNMGSGLADGCPPLDGEGNPAGDGDGNDFRTAPLWGLSTRTTYMHDGRAATLAVAIEDHDLGTGSEAHQVIQNYKALSPGDQAALLEFIGSL